MQGQPKLRFAVLGEGRDEHGSSCNGPDLTLFATAKFGAAL